MFKLFRIYVIPHRGGENFERYVEIAGDHKKKEMDDA